MVGESKRHFQRGWRYYSPVDFAFHYVGKSDTNEEQLFTQAKAQLKQQGITYPLVAKPDLGCRGVGVKLVNGDRAQRLYCSIPFSRTLSVASSLGLQC